MNMPHEIGVYLEEMTRAHESCVEEEVRIAICSAYVEFLKEKLVVAEHELRLETVAYHIQIPCGNGNYDDELPF